MFGLVEKWGMIGNMVRNKSGDEVIGMVIGFMEGKMDGLVWGTTGLNKMLGRELCWEKVIF